MDESRPPPKNPVLQAFTGYQSIGRTGLLLPEGMNPVEALAIASRLSPGEYLVSSEKEDDPHDPARPEGPEVREPGESLLS